MESNRADLLAACYQSFMERDYEECIDMMVELGMKSGFRLWSAILMISPEVLQIRQMFLICQQRLGKGYQAELDSATFFLGHSQEKFWFLEVLRLTLGQVSMEEVLALASREVEICQTYYYAAERQATEREWLEALELFKKCSRFSVDCPELAFSKARIRWLESRNR